jgi:lysophospholipase L1-like esterase
LYPGSELEVITSVEGGKGAGYYREEGRVASYVSRYEPGLVMIGGISQANDTAAVHDVIRQIREQMEPEPDIMLMSGPMGRQGDPRRNAAFPLQPSPDGFRRQLAGLADQTNTAYFDLKTAWGEYLASTNASYDYFLRDELHANQRGRQVLASIMADYFSPPEAKNANDPATD